jgi:hypothetical protein
MSHNARVRADVTAWEAAIPLEPSELDALDEGQFSAINGDDGGSWAPSDPIIIGGAGIEFTGAVPVGEDLTVGGDITIASGGTITIESGGAVNVESGGDVNLAGGGHLHCSGEIHIDDGGRILLQDGGFLFEYSGSEHVYSSGSEGTYNSGSTLALDGTVNVGATAVVTEAANAAVAEGATYTQTGPRYLRGDGRIHQRVIVGPDANASFDGRAGDVVIIESSGLFDDRTYSLLISGCHGTRIRFVSYDALHAVLFTSAAAIYMPTDYNPGSTGLRRASGYAGAVEFMYSDGSAGAPTAGWYVIDHQMVP